MSLIEQALTKQKINADANRKSAPPAPRVRQDSPARSAPVERSPAPVRALRTATVDVAAMERYGVIQQGIDPAAMRAYKILRTQLLRKLDAEGWKSLAVTAIGVGDGKTVTALNLAISLARDVNTRVTLVDLDLQRPAVATYLGLRAELGLDSYLAGNATLEQITYDIGIERLAVIPTLGPVPQSSEMLTSPAMMALLEDLRALGQIVIFDLPPMLLGDDVLALAPHADAVLLVVGEGTTSRSALEGARTVLEDMRIAGVVLNRSSERDDTTYY